MKTYIEQTFIMDIMKHKELHKMCDIVWTPVENLNDYGRNILAHRICGVEEEWVSLYLDEIEDCLIDIDNYEYCIGSDFDDCLWDSTIDSLLGDDDNYIVFNLGNENQYMILNSKFDFLSPEQVDELYIYGGDYRGDMAMIKQIDCYDGKEKIRCIIGVNDADLRKIEENDSMLEFIGDKLSDCILF